MAHFAKIENNIVTNVIVIDDVFEIIGQDYINRQLKLDGRWIQTSYNNNIRGNYAGIGYTYDRINDVFYPSPPFPSWVLNTEWQWEAPIPYPTDEFEYSWDEEILNWVKIS
jgi:hypothetical protein